MNELLLQINIPSGFIQAAQLLLSLSFLVFVHELGHFMAARAFGIRVEKFYIFMDAWGVKLFSKKIGDCEYGIGWLPIGGYVKIAGMIDESMDKEQMEKPAEPWEFRSKPVWQRFIVMIGGIVMNVIFGVLFYITWLQFFQKDYISVNEINKYGIYATEAGQKMGLETGDKILMINGKKVVRDADLLGYNMLFGKTMTVGRNGKEITLEMPKENLMKRVKTSLYELNRSDVFIDTLLPQSSVLHYDLEKGDQIVGLNGVKINNFYQLSDELKKLPQQRVRLSVLRNGKEVEVRAGTNMNGKIGFLPNVDVEKYYQPTPYTFGQSVKYGVKEAFTTVLAQVVGLSKMFKGEIAVRDSVGSPIAIGRLFAKKWDWSRFWLITAMISMVLAFMNLLPIPALDGGHIMFLGIEAVTRKPLSVKVMEKAQIVGMVLLLSLMAFAFGNDILKLLGI